MRPSRKEQHQLSHPQTSLHQQHQQQQQQQLKQAQLQTQPPSQQAHPQQAQPQQINPQPQQPFQPQMQTQHRQDLRQQQQQQVHPAGQQQPQQSVQSLKLQQKELSSKMQACIDKMATTDTEYRDFLRKKLKSLCVDHGRITKQLEELTGASGTASLFSSSDLEAMMAALQARHTDEMSALKAALKLQHTKIISALQLVVEAMNSDHVDDIFALKSELHAVKSKLASVVADRETQCMDGMSALRTESATLKPEQVGSFKSVWSTVCDAITDVLNTSPNLPSAPMGPVKTKETDSCSDDGSEGGSAYLPTVEGLTTRSKADASTQRKGILKTAHPRSYIKQNLLENRPTFSTLRGIAGKFNAKLGIQSGRTKAVPAHLHKEFVAHFERECKSFKHENSDLQVEINSAFDLDPNEGASKSGTDSHGASSRKVG
ncbi:hypothetical protein BJ741DRAFT_213617 [Chytriomyces cf. hyalinus JEL632]|nr:hypothetical protein BJ741DRAFT_213617 [Chytriomyces cf. hyalinus JEL632]